MRGRPANPSGRGRLRAAVIVLHRWLGLLVGLVFVVTGLTGTVVTFDPELTRWQYPALSGSQDVEADVAREHVLDVIKSAHTDPSAELVRFPGAGLPAFEVWLANETREYRDPVSGALLARRDPMTDPVALAREIHTNLLVGHSGETVLGWLGVAMLVMLLTGLWLWWPAAGGWARTLNMPRFGHALVQWHYWHRTLGVATLALLLFVTLTGTAIIFYNTSQGLLTGLFGGDPSAEAPPDGHVEASPVDWSNVLQTLDGVLPAGKTVYYYPPQLPGNPLTFRKKMPGELHPNGRSFVYIAPDGRLLKARDATELAPGLRVTHAIYPLHSGRTGAEWWRWLVGLSGLLPAVLFVTGVVLWWRRRRFRTVVPRVSAEA